MSDLSRRDVLRSGLVAGASLAAGSVAFGAGGATESSDNMQGRPFALDYAPHFGMFRNHAGNDIDELKFMHDQGFRSMEDNGMKGRSVEDQEAIAKTMTQLGMRMGVFVVNGGTAWGATLASGKQDSLDAFLKECQDSVEVAKRVNAKWMTVVCGTNLVNIAPEFQTANVVDALRRACDIFEPHGLVMVLEPLNFRDHANLFLSRIPQAFQICRAVNSPSCKILFDIYHQQIEEGNLIPNMNAAWTEIAYIQIGDNPGRREPTTGEINYANVFRHVKEKGYTGILGMEHGNSRGEKEGEMAVINAYRSVDPST
ncbi:MAG: TIM barrel protein [Fimbriimonadaceae bacterium]|nr:TIM barrel protein [Fimbriimonadaceae bacterium]